MYVTKCWKSCHGNLQNIKMTSDGRIREGYVEEIAFELGFVQVVFGLGREGRAPLGKEHVAKAWLWEGV